ncbi:GPI ethanolamine phosphate transferase [Xylariomycetidae sp. FL0641]|nr:GPI ethanolamine phosphate transferase [Xylariomycetidae sp. FL0641]
MHRNHVFPFSTVLLVAANLLVPVAILIFATGFFPYKPFLPGLAQYGDLPYGSPPEAPFDRIVFMVVDALRSDFVYRDGMGFEYTQSLIANGVAIPFTAHATSPTITMPRIKAMTTGSTPSFLDAILSFDEADTSSTLSVQDTWLAQMKAKGTGKLVMYGDDTWLKLFPDTFDRADGTSSFFVSDFTEVDNNVTRHIADELRNDDWNTMVLHYLGLDHIGHKTGPRGPNMIPKQWEMDGIIRDIYEAMETQPHLKSTLLVFCGDHGMNDAGNHGASSPGETSAALVFVSPKLRAVAKKFKVPADYVDDFQYYNVVEQSDLAPTLAALLGFPIPKNSLGSFILDFLPFWPHSTDKLQILKRNARQILDIVTATLGSSAVDTKLTERDCLHLGSSAEKLVCEWYKLDESVKEVGTAVHADDQSASHISKWLSEAQTLMSGMASNYNVNRLVAGGAVAAVASLAATIAIASNSNVTFPSLAPFTLMTLLYGIMMFASSYVEEEQHFWYWATSAWFLYLTLKRSQNWMPGAFVMAVTCLSLLKLTRSWNQTGQKFAGEPDIVTMYLIPNPSRLWRLVLAAYAVPAYGLYRGLDGIPPIISASIATVVATVAFSFKLAFTNEDAPELVIGSAKSAMLTLEGASLVTRARLVFLSLGLVSLYPLFLLAVKPTKQTKHQALRTLQHLYTLLALTQSRATNAPLFLLFGLLDKLTCSLRPNAAETTITALLLQHAAFFAAGGNNAISGVDLSSAYNGVSGFNIFAVGVLTFVSNWAGTIWWSFAASLMLLQQEGLIVPGGVNRGEGQRGASGGFRLHVAMLTTFVATALVFTMVACTALRTHLFIWTVFSPKFLYSMAWSLGQHLVINVGLGGFLYWLGSR